MAKRSTVRIEDVVTWPREVRSAVDAIAATLSALLMLVRGRAAGSRSEFVRVLAERDGRAMDCALLSREADILRSREGGRAPQNRPHYPPESRLAILQHMRLRQWTVKRACWTV